MKQLRLLSCTLLVLCLMAFVMGGIASATTYYVAKNGSDSNPGTEASPWLTISKAASTLTAGDTVYVKAGTYTEQVVPANSGSAGNYITYEAYPGDTVIVDCNGITYPSYYEGIFTVNGKSYIKIIGFQLKNSTDGFGVMVFDSGYVEVRDNYTYNTQASGIGCWTNAHHVIVEGNEVELAVNDLWQECISVANGCYEVQILNNHIHHSGPGTNGGEGIDIKEGAHDILVKGNYVHDINRLGLYCDAWDQDTYNVTYDSNVVHDCVYYGFAMACERGKQLSNITISNNVLYHNTHAGVCIGDWDNGYPHPMDGVYIVNNTCYDNGSGSFGCGVWHMNPEAVNVVIRNNIFSQNDSDGIYPENDVTNPGTIDHNLFDGPSEVYGTDYIEGDPQFVNPGSSDFHLQSTSPAIDAGSSASVPDHDMDGDSRPDNGLWDMGADEYISGPQPPNANFSGNPTSGDAPLTVLFSDLSSGSPTSWSWTFGDGGSSTAQNPSHDYTSAGDYAVSLEATNANGSDTETKTDYISVSEPPAPPVADFSGSPTSGDAPLSVSFTDLSTNSPTAWSWTFGDGGSSTAQNPSHNYTVVGDYTVSLEATNEGGSDTETKTDYISVSEPPPAPPVANFEGSPTSGDAPLSVSFTDLSTGVPTSWSWTFGDGGSSTAQNPSHDYTSAGDYTVSLTATNAQGQDTETKTDYISATEPGSEQTIFSDDFEDEFSGWNITSWVYWYDGEPKNGTHSIHLTKQGAMDQTISTVDYNDIEVEFYMGASSLETGEYCQALWYDGSNWTVMAQIDDTGADGQLHLYEISLPAGASNNANFALKFECVAANASDSMYVDDVVVLGTGGSGPPPAPVADFSGSPTSGDAPLSVSFTDLSSNSPTAWSWTFGDGGSSSAQNPSHDYTSAGDYTVSLEATNAGGSDTETKTDYISVSEPVPAPVADFSGTPTSGDAPLTVNFTDLSSNSPTSWDWTFGDGGSSTAQNPSHDYTSAGDYTVSLEATNAGGSDTETKTDYISVSSPVTPPVADFSGSPTSGEEPLSVSFTDLSTNSPTSWSWTFGDGGSSSAQNPSHDYTSAGDYTVSLEAANAGGSDTETKTDYISVSEAPPAPPVADFSGSPTSGDAPLTVNFTDLSSNSPTSWSWTFGDGGSSSAQNPSHDYTSAGDYTVSLEATNAGGSDTETKTDYISVSAAPAPPVADFSGSPLSGNAPLTVNFTDLSSNSPTSWSWTFGDGGSSTAQNPSHEYTAVGDYTVSLEATNADGSDTETKTDYISVSESGGEETIFSDDFEAEFAGWNTSGWQVSWYDGEPKNGTHSIQIVNNAYMDQTISTAGYSDIEVTFYMGAKSLEAGENVQALWYDGSTWTVMAQIDDGGDDELLHLYEISLPAGAADNANFAVKFQANAANASDFMYVDDVVVNGTS